MLPRTEFHRDEKIFNAWLRRMILLYGALAVLAVALIAVQASHGMPGLAMFAGTSAAAAAP